MEAAYILENMLRPNINISYNNETLIFNINCTEGLVFPSYEQTAEVSCDCLFDRNTFETALDEFGSCLGEFSDLNVRC